VAVPYAAYACNEGSGTSIIDYSGNGFNMTISGTGNTWVTGHGYANAFEGSITAGSNGAEFNFGSLDSALSGDVTVMGWVQSAGTATQQAYGFGLFQSSGTARLAAYAYRSLSGTAAAPQITARDSASNLYSFGSNGTTVDNNFHHIAAVFHSAGGIDLYYDGTLVGNFTTTAGIGTTVQFWGLGAILAGGQTAAAAVNDFRIFAAALTSTDIVTWMNTPVVSSGVTATLGLAAAAPAMALAGTETGASISAALHLAAAAPKMALAGSQGGSNITATLLMAAAAPRMALAGLESQPVTGTLHLAAAAPRMALRQPGTGGAARPAAGDGDRPFRMKLWLL
jgi:Concanavalin A-like lectin/glucanases superfamily